MAECVAFTDSFEIGTRGKGTYEITGNQPVPGTGFVDFVAMARAAGFQRTFSFDDPVDYQTQLPAALGGDGPVLIAVRVEPGLEGPLSRTPREQARYLQVSLAESAHRLRDTLTASETGPPVTP